MKYFITTFIILFSFFTYSEAYAATYYVDATLGDNANAGTAEGDAWQTLTKVNTTNLQPGDTVLFKRGETFAGRLAIGESGTAGNFITFGAYGTGAKPIIDATGQSYAIDIQSSKSYSRFENLDIQNATSGGVLIFDSSDSLQFDGLNISGPGTGIYVLNGTTSNLSINNTEIDKTGLTTNAITIQANTSDLVISNVTTIQGEVGVYFAGTFTTTNASISDSNFSSANDYGVQQVSDHTINGLTINDTTVNNNGLGGMFTQGSISDLEINDSYFNSNLTGSGLNIATISGKSATGITITSTEANSNTGSGFAFQGTGDTLSISNSTATGNTLYGFGIRRIWSGVSVLNSTFSSNSSGISIQLDNVAASMSDLTFTGVTANTNTGNGIQIFGDSGSGTDINLNNVTASTNANDGINVKGNWTDVDITGCSTVGNGTVDDGDGITYHNSTTGDVKYCFISNNRKSGFAHVVNSSVNMSYNIIRHDTNGTIALAHFEGTGTFNFFNNTLYSPAQTGEGIENNGATVNLRNNILYGFDTGILHTGGTTDSDYNLVYNAGTANWSGLTQGANSLSLNPLFTNAGSDNFTLQTSSPAIDEGEEIGEAYDDGLHPTTTFPSSISTADQDLRGNGWEIGAYVQPVPQAPTFDSVSALSDSSLRFSFTDNASDETGFKLFTAGDIEAVDEETENLSSITLTELTQNTGYSGYYIKAYNSYGESPASATSAEKYTLASTPSSITASINKSSIRLTTPSILNQEVDNSGYFFSNQTKGVNSGWIQNNSWLDDSLSCNNEYSYTIKVRNAEAVETATASADFETGNCSTKRSTVSISYMQKFPDFFGLSEEKESASNNHKETEITSLPSNTVSPFTRYLSQGDINEEVRKLQIFLNQFKDTQVASSGAGSPGNETNYFGPLTRIAVIKFQEKYPEEILSPWGLTQGTGKFHRTTLQQANTLINKG